MFMDIRAESLQLDAVPGIVMLDVIQPLAVATEDARNPLAACGLPRPVSGNQDISGGNALTPLGELLGQVLHHGGLLGAADFPWLDCSGGDVQRAGEFIESHRRRILDNFSWRCEHQTMEQVGVDRRIGTVSSQHTTERYDPVVPGRANRRGQCRTQGEDDAHVWLSGLLEMAKHIIGTRSEATDQPNIEMDESNACLSEVPEDPIDGSCGDTAS